MPKNDNLQKHTLNLRRGDMEAIATYYPDLPSSVIIRRVISAFIDQIEEAGNASINAKVEIKL